MKASVALITYNHAPYIAQAIESVLMQQTRFDFELLIGEDESSDGTREIVREYQAKYPDKIRLLLGSRKDVLHIRGRPTGRRNLVNSLERARGQYVALLEGDDYWTSPLKLQKQVEFLENNPDCALCFHNVQILDEIDPKHRGLHHANPMRNRYVFDDLMDGNFLATCSVVYRSGLFGRFPDWYFESPAGDWPLHVLNTRHGNIGYLPEVMAVYRKHAEATWAGLARSQMLLATIQTAECIRIGLDPGPARRLDATMARWHVERIKLCSATGDHQAAARMAADYFKTFSGRVRTRPWRVLRYVLAAKVRFAWRWLSGRSRPLLEK